jgi:hypothetical protein
VYRNLLSSFHYSLSRDGENVETDSGERDCDAKLANVFILVVLISMAWERMRRKKREKENTNSSEKNDKTFKKRKRKNKGVCVEQQTKRKCYVI